MVDVPRSASCDNAIDAALASAASTARTAVAPAVDQFYICGPTTAMVDLETDGIQIARLGYDMQTGETADLTGLSDVQRAEAMAAIAPEEDAEEESANRDVVGFFRIINGPYRETLSWPIEYGNASEGGFAAVISNTFALSLGQEQVQYIRLDWTNLANRQVTPEIGVDLQRMDGLLPPYTVASTGFGSGEGVNFVYRTSYTDQTSFLTNGTNKKYSIRTYGYSFWDRYAAPGGHFFSFDGDIGTGHRWQCVNWQVCEFPGGNEAPIF